MNNIENSEENLEISLMDDLIGIHPRNEKDFSKGEKSNSNSIIEPIFFPKEYNYEQIEIIEKARNNKKGARTRSYYSQC